MTGQGWENGVGAEDKVSKDIQYKSRNITILVLRS